MAIARTPELNRRESLYYLWLASIAILVFGLSAFLIWFTLPIPRTQTPSIIISIDVEDVPPLGSAIGQNFFFLSHTDDDALIALDPIIPNVGCLIRWFPPNHRFEDPCHGVKFRLDGTLIEGMKYLHDLNRYSMTITFTSGQTVSTNPAGDPIPLEGRKIASITVDICHRIEGKKETNPLSGPVYSLVKINRDCIR
jgi:hypothetical protein